MPAGGLCPAGLQPENDPGSILVLLLCSWVLLPLWVALPAAACALSTARGRHRQLAPAAVPGLCRRSLTPSLGFARGEHCAHHRHGRHRGAGAGAEGAGLGRPHPHPRGPRDPRQDHERHRGAHRREGPHHHEAVSGATAGGWHQLGVCVPWAQQAVSGDVPSCALALQQGV